MKEKSKLPDYLRINLVDVSAIFGYNQRRGHGLAGAMACKDNAFFCSTETKCPEFKSILLSEPYVKPLEARIIRGLSR